MDCGKQAVQRFEPTEAVAVERNDGGGGRGGGSQHLQPFTVAEIEQRVNALQVGLRDGRRRKL